MSAHCKTVFASALMLAAVSATDDVSHAISNLLHRTTHDQNAISPKRRFNLEAVLPPHFEEEENEPFWKTDGHEYEPPVHQPYRHMEEMPDGPVYTVHDYPVDRKAHPGEMPHPTHLVKYQNDESENFLNEEEPPRNYFYENPVPPNPIESDRNTELHFDEKKPHVAMEITVVQHPTKHIFGSETEKQMS